MSLLWDLGCIPWHLSCLYSSSLAFLLVLERIPASFVSPFLGVMKCCHTEVSGHVALRVATTNPYAKWHGGVCFLSADGVIAACVCVSVCDTISLSRAGGGMYLQQLSHNCWALKKNKGGVEEGNGVAFKWKASTQHLNEAGKPLMIKMTAIQWWEAGTPHIWRCSSLLTATIGSLE